MSQVIESIDVDVPVRTAYNEWTQFESFPKFLHYVEEITQIDDTHNHWRVRIGGVEREFDTVITESTPTSASPGTQSAGKTSTPAW